MQSCGSPYDTEKISTRSSRTASSSRGVCGFGRRCERTNFATAADTASPPCPASRPARPASSPGRTTSSIRRATIRLTAPAAARSHPVPREDGNQHAVALRVVADVGRTRHAGDQLYFLAGFVARYGRITPARDEDPAADDLDAVEPARALGDHTRRLVPQLPREH